MELPKLTLTLDGGSVTSLKWDAPRATRLLHQMIPSVLRSGFPRPLCIVRRKDASCIEQWRRSNYRPSVGCCQCIRTDNHLRGSIGRQAMNGEIDREGHRISIKGSIRVSDLHVLCSILHQAIDQRGYPDVILDFSVCDGITEAVMELPKLTLTLDGGSVTSLKWDSESRRMVPGRNYGQRIQPRRVSSRRIRPSDSVSESEFRRIRRRRCRYWRSR